MPLSKIQDIGNQVIPNLGSDRNMLINGKFDVSQRNGTAAVTVTDTNSAYPIDRWTMYNNSGGNMIMQQVTDVPSGEGFTHSAKVSVSSVGNTSSSDHALHIEQKIEVGNMRHLGWGTSSPKTCTLSFYVKSSVTGTYAIHFGNDVDRFYVSSYTINSADTWEKKTITLTGATDGNWNTTTNARGLEIVWSLLAGSAFTTSSLNQWISTEDFHGASHVQWATNSGATWFLAGCQFEIGENPTEFEHEPFERTLDKCRRYAYVMGGDGIYERFAVGHVESSTQARCLTFYPTTMRAVPTTSKTDPLIVGGNFSPQSITSISVDYNSKTVGHVQYNVSSGLDTGEACAVIANNNANARLTFDAEL